MKRKNTKWKQMENDLSMWLQTFARDGICFRSSHQAIKGFPPDGFKSDGMLTDDKVLIAIEVECGQKHPDTNTGKYWLLHEYKTYEKIILFHMYTPDFNSYGKRKELAGFYIKKMKKEVPVEYILLDFRDANNYDRALKNVKKEIRKRVKEEFK